MSRAMRSSQMEFKHVFMPGYELKHTLIIEIDVSMLYHLNVDVNITANFLGSQRDAGPLTAAPVGLLNIDSRNRKCRITTQ